VAAVGISDQRETTVVWDRRTGRPVHRAIVWQDLRTGDAVARLSNGEGGQDRFRARTGLPISTYSSALKLRWILGELTRGGGAGAPDPRHLAFGTIDSWLIWQLTGGIEGGRHVTDVTNASRTMLMDLETCRWDEGILEELGIPGVMLPEVTASSEVVGRVASTALADLAGVPIAGNLGDQQAALFGQTCFDPGQAKCTYGTGAFMLTNTGERPVQSRNGLITTVAARTADGRTTYALEGSVAVAGSLIQWLRDQLGLIDDAADIEPLARSVPDAGEIVIVPAFSGLFAPHWRPDARGIIAGLTRFGTKAHLARAALEATAYQVFELDEAMAADLGGDVGQDGGVGPGGELGPADRRDDLRVDGGMTRNDLLMQIQADLLGRPVAVPPIAEISALGAAYAAGLAVGFWASPDELRAMDRVDRRWEPDIDPAVRAAGIARWRKGVERSLAWVD
jgi:glycerol kinase